MAPLTFLYNKRQNYDSVQKSRRGRNRFYSPSAAYGCRRAENSSNRLTQQQMPGIFGGMYGWRECVTFGRVGNMQRRFAASSSFRIDAESRSPRSDIRKH
jgi:hypothetical protein